MLEEQLYNFIRIDDTTATSGLVNETQLAALGDAGYQCVINLLPQDLDYAVKNEQELVEAQGIDYTYIPVDFDAPGEENYLAFVAALQAASGKNVLVHCAANYRVSAFYALYANQQLGWDKARCLQHIARIWKLEEHPQWQSFVDERLR